MDLAHAAFAPVDALHQMISEGERELSKRLASEAAAKLSLRGKEEELQSTLAQLAEAQAQIARSQLQIGELQGEIKVLTGRGQVREQSISQLQEAVRHIAAQFENSQAELGAKLGQYQGVLEEMGVFAE